MRVVVGISLVVLNSPIVGDVKPPQLLPFVRVCENVPFDIMNEVPRKGLRVRFPCLPLLIALT